MTFKKDDFIYQPGDSANRFYFMIRGKVELLVKTEGTDEFKYSKGIDESQYFGNTKNFNEMRNLYAKIISDKAEVLSINTEKYYNILSQTQLSEGDRKVEFLFRYVPKLRKLPRNLLEDFEVYFQREQCTKGF